MIRSGFCLALAACMIACGGGTETPAATVEFRVTQVTPGDNSVDVPLKQEINVVFSREIDPDSLDGTSLRVVAESGDVILGDREVARLSRQIVRFLPRVGYVPYAIHTIEVGPGVRDVGGKALGQSYEFHFRAQEDVPVLIERGQIEDLGDALFTGRWLHRMTLLPSNRFLVAGGYQQSGTVTDTAEILVPALKESFNLAGGMLQARAAHVQVLLADGRVLLAGGEIADNPFLPTATCEIYDPAGAGFTVAASLNVARSFAHGVRLADGRVLVTGGQSLLGGVFHYRDDAEIYDPQQDSWTTVATPMSAARSGHFSALLPDGRVFVAGGSSGVVPAELFDPSTQLFLTTDPAAITAHFLGAGTVLPDGRPFLAGGFGSRGLTLLDPTFGILGGLNDMPDESALATATAFLDGRVILVGGTDFSVNPAFVRDTIIVFYPIGATGRFVRVPDVTLPRPTSHHAAARGPNGSIWVTGGLPIDLAFPALRQIVLIHPEEP
jgi:hypothetical protein